MAIGLSEEMKQLNLDQLSRILRVVSEVREEIGAPCTVDDVVAMYEAEERAVEQEWVGEHVAA